MWQSNSDPKEITDMESNVSSKGFQPSSIKARASRGRRLCLKAPNNSYKAHSAWANNRKVPWIAITSRDNYRLQIEIQIISQKLLKRKRKGQFRSWNNALQKPQFRMVQRNSTDSPTSNTRFCFRVKEKTQTCPETATMKSKLVAKPILMACAWALVLTR